MLELAFFARPADRVAKDLLGQILVVKDAERVRKGRIVETEAYLGEADLACHASKGRTPRTKVMFGPPGHAYVYLIYGIHYMFNIVTDCQDSAHAVLIRALEPLENVVLASDGPGKLCRAMSIDKIHNGLALFGPELWLERGQTPAKIGQSSRIGVDYAKDWKDAPLRFFDAESPWVSKPK